MKTCSLIRGNYRCQDHPSVDTTTIAKGKPLCMSPSPQRTNIWTSGVTKVGSIAYKHRRTLNFVKDTFKSTLSALGRNKLAPAL